MTRLSFWRPRRPAEGVSKLLLAFVVLRLVFVIADSASRPWRASVLDVWGSGSGPARAL